LKDLYPYIVGAVFISVLSGFLGFFIATKCSETDNALIESIRENREEFLDSLEIKMERHLARADSFSMKQTIINEYYNYVYQTIDSLYIADSVLVNAVVRFWADSIQRILKITPDFSRDSSD